MGVNVHLHIKKKEDKSGVEYYVDLCKLEVRLENIVCIWQARGIRVPGSRHFERSGHSTFWDSV